MSYLPDRRGPLSALPYVPPNHDVREPLPEMRTHGEWCRWLKSRGSLSEKHRRCLFGEECVASADPGRTVVAWRSRSN